MTHTSFRRRRKRRQDRAWTLESITHTMYRESNTHAMRFSGNGSTESASCHGWAHTHEYEQRYDKRPHTHNDGTISKAFETDRHFTARPVRSHFALVYERNQLCLLHIISSHTISSMRYHRLAMHNSIMRWRNRFGACPGALGAPAGVFAGSAAVHVGVVAYDQPPRIFALEYLLKLVRLLSPTR